MSSRNGRDVAGHQVAEAPRIPFFSLLTGCRPNEAALLNGGYRLPTPRIVFANTKAGADVTVPMTREIAAALRIVSRHAAACRVSQNGGDLVFPSCRKSSRKDKLVKGHALRHTYRTVAAELGIDELLVRLLMGHSLVGVSQAYIAKAALTGGISMREAQRRSASALLPCLRASRACLGFSPCGSGHRRVGKERSACERATPRHAPICGQSAESEPLRTVNSERSRTAVR